jgi:glycosyltransferase involved in cell wall biosynthesis
MVEDKRIVILIDRYLPILGGAQKNIHQIGKLLAKSGTQVKVLTRMVLPELAEEEEIDGIRVRRFGNTRHRIISKALAILQTTLHLVRTRNQYDGMVCVLAAYYTELLPAYLSSLVTKKPYLVRTTMTKNFDHMLSYKMESKKDPLKKIAVPPFLWRRALNRSEGVVVQSKPLLERARDYRIPNIIYIPSGVDMERFTKADEIEKRRLRKKYGLPLDRVIVTNTARYIPEKNHITLIKAVECLEKELRPGKAALLLIGATEEQEAVYYEQELRQYVQEVGLEEVVFFVNDVEKVEDYLKASDIFVLPTMFDEGMSNSALEAMAVGLPVIASSVPQVKHMFPEDWSLFFDPQDYHKLAARLASLVDSKEMRVKAGERLEAFASEHYEVEQVMVHYEAAIDSALNRNGRSSA